MFGVPRVTTQREELVQELLFHGFTQSSKRVDLFWFYARETTNSIGMGGEAIDIPGFSSPENSISPILSCSCGGKWRDLLRGDKIGFSKEEIKDWNPFLEQKETT